MKISLSHLLLMFPAFFIAVMVVAWFYSSFDVYHHNQARMQSRRILGYIESIEVVGGNKINEDDVNKLLAGQLPANHPLLAKMASPCIDPWGNPYVFMRKANTANSSYEDAGVFSMGRDGMSRTKGNDPDDLNSWNFDSGRQWYMNEIIRSKRISYCIRGAVITPLTYLGLLAILKLGRWFRSLHYEDAIKFTTTEKREPDW